MFNDLLNEDFDDVIEPSGMVAFSRDNAFNKRLSDMELELSFGEDDDELMSETEELDYLMESVLDGTIDSLDEDMSINWDRYALEEQASLLHLNEGKVSDWFFGKFLPFCTRDFHLTNEMMENNRQVAKAINELSSCKNMSADMYKKYCANVLAISLRIFANSVVRGVASYLNIIPILGGFAWKWVSNKLAEGDLLNVYAKNIAVLRKGVADLDKKIKASKDKEQRKELLEAKNRVEKILHTTESKYQALNRTASESFDDFDLMYEDSLSLYEDDDLMDEDDDELEEDEEDLDETFDFI